MGKKKQQRCVAALMAFVLAVGLNPAVAFAAFVPAPPPGGMAPGSSSSVSLSGATTITQATTTTGKVYSSTKASQNALLVNTSGSVKLVSPTVTKATNLTVSTLGASSAAIRSDRGGGIVTVNKGTYKTIGVGSPAIYATATVNVSNATLTSTASQGVVNEGGNTVVLKNCTMNAGNKTLNSQDKFRNGVFVYQSTRPSSATCSWAATPRRC